MEAQFRSGFWVLIVFVIFFSLSGDLVSVESRRPKNVQVALQAKWSGTPILLEAGYALFTLFDSWVLSVLLKNYFLTSESVVIFLNESLLNSPNVCHGFGLIYVLICLQCLF